MAVNYPVIKKELYVPQLEELKDGKIEYTNKTIIYLNHICFSTS